MVYLYSQGGQKNYIPPEVKKESNEEQVITDLVSLSHAIESYYAINLFYPSSLKDLVPDFINKLPKDQSDKSDFIYTFFADSAYEISVQNPYNYNLKELRVRNGKLIKN